FDFLISYRPGKHNLIADKLSHKGQELSEAYSQRLRYRTIRLLQDSQLGQDINAALLSLRFSAECFTTTQPSPASLRFSPTSTPDFPSPTEPQPQRPHSPVSDSDDETVSVQRNLSSSLPLEAVQAASEHGPDYQLLRQ
ncbi:hypothetical protein KEM55_000853, partial [Ascosphaera atra]